MSQDIPSFSNYIFAVPLMAQYIHCFKPSNVAAPQLWLDLHWPSTSCVSGPSVLQDLFGAGPPCCRSATRPPPPKTSTFKHLHYCYISIASGLPLLLDLHCLGLISIVSGPLLLQGLQYCRTSNVEYFHCCRASAVDVPPLSQDLHCPYLISIVTRPPLFEGLLYPITSTASGTSLSHSGPPQGLHCCSTFTVTGHLLSQPHLHGLWVSTTVGTPNVTGPLLSQHLQLHSTTSEAGPPLSQHLQCCRTSRVTGLPLSQDLTCHSTSNVSRPPLLQQLHCLRTSTSAVHLM